MNKYRTSICRLALAPLVLAITGCNPVQDTKLAEATSTQFLQKMQGHQYQQAYQLMSAECQAATTVKDTKAYWGLIENGRGKVKNWSRTGVRVSSFNFKTTVQLGYQLQCTKGTGGVTFAVVEEAGQWKVQRFDVNL